MLFYYLAPYKMTPSWRHDACSSLWGQERGLPVGREGKKSIGRKMKYGHANLNSFCAHTNERVCVSISLLSPKVNCICSIREHNSWLCKVIVYWLIFHIYLSITLNNLIAKHKTNWTKKQALHCDNIFVKRNIPTVVLTWDALLIWRILWYCD